MFREDLQLGREQRARDGVQQRRYLSLPPASKDAALLVTLAPGNYPVQVRSVDDTTGVVLVEVYAVP